MSVSIFCSIESGSLYARISDHFFNSFMFLTVLDKDANMNENMEGAKFRVTKSMAEDKEASAKFD